MPLHTTTTIRIESHPKLAGTFEALELHEDINGHHRFTLRLPVEAFGAGKGTGRWRKVVGKRISIKIEPSPSTTGQADYQSKRFSGLITGVSMGKGYGPNGSVRLEGGSPTLLLEDNPHTQSFSKRSLKDIAGKLLGKYPVNMLHPQVNPKSSGSQPYLVQYKENSWQFLQRLARTYGEWCYYDGEHVVFGRRQPETLKLTHDVHLDNFDLCMNLRPANMQLAGYDYGGDKVTQQKVQAESGLPAHPQAAADASKSLFSRKGTYTPNRPMNGQTSKQIKNAAKRHQKASTAEMVHMSGESHQPGLTVGGHVKIDESLYGKEHYGEYMLTGIHHYCSSDGGYRNHFVGVPAEVAAPPHQLDDHPIAEPQSAVVKDNHDPKNLGRVQVQLRWQEGQRTPWLRTLSPSGGKGKGLYMIPEIGEEVMVGFIGGHPERPYVMGASWNGSDPAEMGTPKNDVKAIKTRSGHVVELNDKKGGEFITIKDKNGNEINIDTAEDNMTITAQKNMTLNAKNFKLNVKEDANFNIGKNTVLQTGENFDVSAKNTTQIIQKNMKLENSGKYSLIAAEGVVQSDGDLKLSGAGLATLKGGKDAKVSKG